MQKGTLKIPKKMGCPAGEVRSMVSGQCFKILKIKPRGHTFNIRSRKTGRVLKSTATGGKNTFSAILKATKDFGEPVQITFEQVLWDSKKDKPIQGRYMFRNGDILKTGYIP